MGAIRTARPAIAAPPPLVLTCEHGGQAVPAPWRHLARGRGRLLASHRGHDAGAAELTGMLARDLGSLLAGPPLVQRATRLLVDTNRSLGHPGLFGALGAALAPAQRERLVARIWRPHRARVRAALGLALRRAGRVVHVGVHSFTPVLAGRRRPMHVGLLYDPRRPREAALARRWQAELRARLPRLVVRRNAPYRGDSDGLTTSLRAELGPRYLGLELEVRSDRLRDVAARRALARALAAALAAALVPS